MVGLSTLLYAKKTKQKKEHFCTLLNQIKDTRALSVKELESKNSSRFGMRMRLISSLVRFIQG